MSEAFRKLKEALRRPRKLYLLLANEGQASATQDSLQDEVSAIYGSLSEACKDLNDVTPPLKAPHMCIYIYIYVVNA